MSDEYRPTVTKINVERLRLWIDKRLTELLDGLEDEILWDMVFNFLADAQKRSRKEGPEVNPTGGLDRKVLKEAIVGFLGQSKSTIFVNELFAKLKEAEERGEEEQALDIISSVKNRPERSLNDRVRHEVRHAHRDRQRDDRAREYRRGDRYYDRSRSPGRERERSRESERDRYRDRSRDRYERHRDVYDDRDRHRYRDERRYRDEERREDRYREERHRDEERYRRDERREERHREERYRDEERNLEDRNYSKREYSVSPVPIRRQMSPGLERRREPSWENENSPIVPKAPNFTETIPSSLEAALRERALQSKNKN